MLQSDLDLRDLDLRDFGLLTDFMLHNKYRSRFKGNLDLRNFFSADQKNPLNRDLIVFQSV